MPDLLLSSHDYLLRTITTATTGMETSRGDASLLQEARKVPMTRPDLVQAAVREATGRDAVVTGPLDRRLVLIPSADPRSDWLIADLSGQPHASRSWPHWVTGHLVIDEPGSWLSTATVDDEAEFRLRRPRVLLSSLYHPENFPLPRFPLAISDLARAARKTLLGQVELMDMQLGVSLDELIARASSAEVDIVGVSATFGQHDLMIELLDALAAAEHSLLVVVGGSLTVRNEALLLERYPDLIVGRGAGEATMADVLSHWHDDLLKDHIRGAGYTGAARGEGTMSIAVRRRSATVANRMQTDIWPELDLLERTFAHHGVAQLESSRGCTNYCSFCPRGHKGQWAGASPDALPWILREIGQVADRFPDISKTLYLVDEEFVGRGPDAVPRALAVADTLHEAGFRWETSCRADQAVRLDHARDWHVERGHLWRGLVERGLRRCLFGIESGVTSILERFNKDTTGTQNALAIRTLTALGVPPRFTYITFDQLMTLGELRETYAFQGRTDLLLRPQPDLSVEDIVDGVRDEQWVAEHSTGRPFYTGISYMLVSMECLIGAAYTRQAEAAGLTGEPDPSMGRVEASFADWRIGIASHQAQLWIDRNFALDYTLKSLEKVTDGSAYRATRTARAAIKTAAYDLLGAMIEAAETATSHEAMGRYCAAEADLALGALREHLQTAIPDVLAALTHSHRQTLQREYGRWSDTDGWRLINAADPCGT